MAEETRTYIINARHTRRIKVGVSTDPSKRLAQLQTGCPDALDLMLHLAGNRERELHGALRPWLLRGEWFELDHAGLVALCHAVPSIARQYCSHGYTTPRGKEWSRFVGDVVTRSIEEHLP